MSLLPGRLPSIYTAIPGSGPVTTTINTGGYDVLVGGIGFRLATDQNYPFKRVTEPTTIRRVDQSYEPGEQTLSQLPWIKSQSSFHGGAGQQNLEAPFTNFQYQQEQITHIRFDTSLGIDCWTPGKVSRLPDTTFSAFGFAATTMCTATVGGIDYAIIGGAQSLYQVVWASGPDAAPTVTQIDLSGSAYGGISNCTISNLTTDGGNYFALIQLNTAGYVPGVLTYVAKGSVTSTAAPIPLYEAPNFGSASARTNLCVDPSFEGASINAAWSAGGTVAPTLSQSTAAWRSGTKSMKVTAAGANSFFPGAVYTCPTTAGQTYTFSCYIYNPSSGGTAGGVSITSGGAIGTSSTVRDALVRLSITVTATASTTQFSVYFGGSTTAGVDYFYVDDVLIEQSSLVLPYFSGATASTSSDTYAWSGTPNASTSTDTPVPVPGGSQGTIGWAKERLIAGLSNKVYELNTASTVAAHSALPSPRYTHPNPLWTCTAISESPDSVLIAGAVGNQASVMKMLLDSSGATPVLAGATSACTLPLGEIVYSMANYLGAFIALGTNKGVHVASFDTYSGNMVNGPLSLTTKSPVYGLAGADRFIYAGYTNAQADGKTGLARLDLSTQIDTAGRLAWAPDLRPPSTAPTGVGTVTAVSVLPYSGRLIFLTPEGIHVQQGVPGHDPGAQYWIKTSRIRYDTSEPKLFKMGSVRGSLDTGSIQIVGSIPFGSDIVLNTSGPITGNNPPDFRLPQGTNEWLQLKFVLQGQSCVFNSYQVKAIPAPSRQHLIQFSVQLYSREKDFSGRERTDQLQPRERYYAVKALEATGQEVTLTEFTPTGAVNTQVVIDQLDFTSIQRRTNANDFGGTLTFHLRETES
jgi:hypothetical protein